MSRAKLMIGWAAVVLGVAGLLAVAWARVAGAMLPKLGDAIWRSGFGYAALALFAAGFVLVLMARKESNG